MALYEIYKVGYYSYGKSFEEVSDEITRRGAKSSIEWIEELDGDRATLLRNTRGSSLYTFAAWLVAHHWNPGRCSDKDEFYHGLIRAFFQNRSRRRWSFDSTEEEEEEVPALPPSPSPPSPLPPLPVTPPPPSPPDSPLPLPPDTPSPSTSPTPPLSSSPPAYPTPSALNPASPLGSFAPNATFILQEYEKLRKFVEGKEIENKKPHQILPAIFDHFFPEIYPSDDSYKSWNYQKLADAIARIDGALKDLEIAYNLKEDIQIKDVRALAGQLEQELEVFQNVMDMLEKYPDLKKQLKLDDSTLINPGEFVNLLTNLDALGYTAKDYKKLASDRVKKLNFIIKRKKKSKASGPDIGEEEE